MSIGVVAAHSVASQSFALTVAGMSPAAWYRLGEASGTTMTDSSGNGRNGVYNGSPWTPPTLGQTGLIHDGDTNTAALFNGTTSEAEVTYDAAWMNNTTFSVFARIKPNTVTGNHSVVGRYVSTGGSVNAWVIRQDANIAYLWYHNGTNYFSRALGTVVSGIEYSVGVVVGGGTIKVYFNGLLVSTVTDTIRSSTANLMIGANWQGSVNELFSGVLDEIIYWNGTLTDGQQASLHDSAAAHDYDSLILARSPAYYWKTDEASFTNGQVLIDSSGNGRGLTLHGSGLSAQGSLLTSGVGGSLAFDGSAGTYGSLTSAAWMNTNSFTLTFLVYITTGDTWHFNRWGVTSGQRDWAALPVGWFTAWVGGAQKDAYLTSFGTGKFHVGFRLSYNGSTTTQTVFKNGVSVASRTDSGSVNLNSTDLIVAKSDTTSASARISRVGYFDTALSDADIAAFAAAA